MGLSLWSCLISHGKSEVFHLQKTTVGIDGHSAVLCGADSLKSMSCLFHWLVGWIFRQCHTVYLWLVWNSLYNPDWPQTHPPPTTTSRYWDYSPARLTLIKFLCMVWHPCCLLTSREPFYLFYPCLLCPLFSSSVNLRKSISTVNCVCSLIWPLFITLLGLVPCSCIQIYASHISCS